MGSGEVCKFPGGCVTNGMCILHRYVFHYIIIIYHFIISSYVQHYYTCWLAHCLRVCNLQLLQPPALSKVRRRRLERSHRHRAFLAHLAPVPHAHARARPAREGESDPVVRSDQGPTLCQSTVLDNGTHTQEGWLPGASARPNPGLW